MVPEKCQSCLVENILRSHFFGLISQLAFSFNTKLFQLGPAVCYDVYSVEITPVKLKIASDINVENDSGQFSNL